MIGYLLPSDGHVLLHSLCAFTPLMHPTPPHPHLLDRYPQSLGIKAVLKLVLPGRLSRRDVQDELTQFSYFFTIYLL